MKMCVGVMLVEVECMCIVSVSAKWILGVFVAVKCMFVLTYVVISCVWMAL